MPCYNTGSYIAQSIRSVLDQTYPHWELLIVDDRSTDDSIEVIRGFSDDRIRLLQNERTSGAAVSRNYALREARGKWIAFLDSDDLWAPDKLEKQLRFMKERDCRFSYTQYADIDADGALTGTVTGGPKRISKHNMFQYCWPGCLTVMYDAEAVGLIQVADIRKHNDYAMWLKVCRKAECRLLPEVLAYYRKGRNGSVSTHSYAVLIRWHYRLFRQAEQNSVPLALWRTARNLVFGFFKKLVYVKKTEPEAL